MKSSQTRRPVFFAQWRCQLSRVYMCHSSPRIIIIITVVVSIFNLFRNESKINSSSAASRTTETADFPMNFNICLLFAPEIGEVGVEEWSMAVNERISLLSTHTRGIGARASPLIGDDHVGRETFRVRHHLDHTVCVLVRRDFWK